MDAKLQRRVQRYGWDLAAADYERLWQAQLAPAHTALLQMTAIEAGEHVLDIACGTGLVSFAAASAVGVEGVVLGTDISERMVRAAAEIAGRRDLRQVRFQRMEAEALDLPSESFDVALCALGFMYLPEPDAALAEIRRVLRPGGRMALAVWGERSRCGWSAVFPVVEAEVTSEVCPLFFQLGSGDALSNLLEEAGFTDVRSRRLARSLVYPDGETAAAAAFVGGPVALAWSRFDAATRQRAVSRYLAAIAPWRDATGSYALPGEFVVASARRP